MERDLQELEDALKNLRPTPADAACLDRLVAAMEGRLQVSDPGLSCMERDLAALKPSALGEELRESLLGVVARVPFPVDGNVVLFPGKVKAASVKAGRRPWWTAAAAVAMAGAFSALMLENGGGSSREEATAEAGRSAATGREPAAGFVPAGAVTGLHDACDQGVIWNSKGEPIRVLRMEYRDRLEYRAADGTVVEQEVPRVEYLVVPEKVD